MQLIFWPTKPALIGLVGVSFLLSCLEAYRVFFSRTHNRSLMSDDKTFSYYFLYHIFSWGVLAHVPPNPHLFSGGFKKKKKLKVSN